MKLLHATLECSIGHSLAVVVKITHDISPYYTPAFDLFTQRSGRWKSTVFMCPFQYFRHFSAVQGNMARLETLVVAAAGDPANMLDLFKLAPNLNAFTLAMTSRNLAVFMHLPIEQISEVLVTEIEENGTDSSIRLLVPRMPRVSDLTVAIILPPATENVAPLPSPPAVAHVSEFCIQVHSGVPVLDAKGVVEWLMDGVTLPYLTNLTFATSVISMNLSVGCIPSSFLSRGARSSTLISLHSISTKS
ncbi:hypothetical protein C8R43DRAFT_1127295 [Mycena crocata]|nr:hypothetical protein C8R43DRAFT_1127295 [Mycena crocata]